MTDGYKIKRGLIRVNGVEKQFYPAGWKPGSNTLLYMPLNSTDTYKDKSGNNVTTTNTNTTFGAYQGVDCAYFNGSNAHIQVNPFSIPSNMTFLAWVYCIWVNDHANGCQAFDIGASGKRLIYSYIYDKGYAIYGNGYTEIGGGGTTNQYMNQWCLIAYTRNGSTMVGYLKGSGVDKTGSRSESMGTFTPTYINIGNEWNNGAARYWKGGISNLIVENRTWTAQEISNYYNQTKSTYGL